jgi:GTPase SAR1 family protein
MKTRRRTTDVGEAMFKIIMTGDSGTGKSCLLNRYVKDTFHEEYHVTIGTHFAYIGAEF